MAATAAVVACLVTPHASGAASPLRSRVWASNDIVDHRFVTTFQLDGGVVTVTPDTSRGTLTLAGSSAYAAAAREAWSFQQLSHYAPGGLGLALVTIRDNVAGVPAVTREKAWVAVAYFNYSKLQCPVYFGKLTAPQWSGWAVAVLGIGPSSPSVVYNARALVCGRVHAATLTNAAEVVSVPWRLMGSGPNIVASLPSCSSSSGWSESGSTTATLSVWDLRLADVALRGCGSSREVSIPPAFNFPAPTRNTHHGPLGMIRQVAP